MHYPSDAAAEPRRTTAPVQAQAYCGPAHGERWALEPHESVPTTVDLATADGSTSRYRLIVHPRTRRPARDHRGRLLYMPVRYQPVAARGSEDAGGRAGESPVDQGPQGCGGLQHDRPAGAEGPAPDLRDALRARAVVEQAKGLLMGRHGCDAGRAGQLLLVAAHQQDMHVHDVAAALTAAAGSLGLGYPPDPAVVAALRDLVFPGEGGDAPRRRALQRSHF